MKRCMNLVIVSIAAVLLLLPTIGQGGERVWGSPEDLEKMRPERPYTWGSDPGGVIYDRRYPPPGVYPYYVVPAPPPYYRHPHMPYPPYAPQHPPYYAYPPYHEPEVPWYRGEAPIPAGRVSVLVDPLDAEVFIDGHPIGRRPDLTYEAGLLQGRYTVEVRAEGYEPYEKNIAVRGGEVISMTIRLKKDQGG